MNIESNEHFFASYFNETKDKIKDNFSAHEWLKTLDFDSLKLLESYIDNFSNDADPENINDTEVADTLLLVERILNEENGNDFSNNFGLMDKKIPEFMAMVVMESLRRKGIVEIMGDGKLTGGNVSCQLTQFGTSIGDAISEKNSEII